MKSPSAMQLKPLTFGVTALLLGYSAVTPAAAAESDAWQIKSSHTMAVADFKLNSPIIADMRTYLATDDTVFAPQGVGDGTIDASNTPLMPIYSLLACMNFTNPNSEMTVDSGGGYDIRVKNAKFASGSWDADVRIIERREINLLDSDTTLLLNKIVVGDLTMETNADRLAALKLLTSACLVN